MHDRNRHTIKSCTSCISLNKFRKNQVKGWYVVLQFKPVYYSLCPSSLIFSKACNRNCWMVSEERI